MEKLNQAMEWNGFPGGWKEKTGTTDDLTDVDLIAGNGFSGSMIVTDTPTRDEFQALRNEIVALRADINYLHQEICLLKLNSVHASADEDNEPEDVGFGEHIVDVSMLLTDKPYRRHDR